MLLEQDLEKVLAFGIILADESPDPADMPVGRQKKMVLEAELEKLAHAAMRGERHGRAEMIQLLHIFMAARRYENSPLALPPLIEER